MEEEGRAIQPSLHVKKLNERAHALLEANSTFISNANFVQSIAALRAAQLPNFQDDQPAAQSIVEVDVIKARCIDILDKMNKEQKRTHPVEPPSGDSRRNLLVEKRKQLQAEVNNLRDGFQYRTENFSDPLLLEQIKHELSSSLGRLDAAYGEMKRELQQHTDTLARTKTTVAELEDLNVALQTKTEALKKEKQMRGGGVSTLEAEAVDLSTKNGKLMRLLADFLEKNYPPVSRQSEKKKRRKDTDESSQKSDDEDRLPPYFTLRETLQELLSLSFRRENDLYTKLTDQFFAPYVELLIRAGIAEKHPSDSTRLRLTPFHK